MLGVGVGVGIDAVQASVLAPSGLTLDLKNDLYNATGTNYATLSSVPGFNYSRSGAISEFGLTGTVYPFATDVAPIIPGEGIYLRAAITNMVIRSQQFDNASWVKTNSTVTADAAVAPDGTTTADNLIDNTTAGGHLISQSVTPVAGTTYFASVCIQQADMRYMMVQLSGAGLAQPAAGVFDFNNPASLTVVNGAFAVTPAVKSLGSGRYQLLISVTAVSTASLTFGVYGNSNGTYAGRSYTGSGQGIAYLWQGQIVAGSNQGPIILTTTGAVTIGASALSVSLANGTYSAVYTFDDGSTQTISTTISGGTFAMPVYPTTLNRPLVQKVTLA